MEIIKNLLDCTPFLEFIGLFFLNVCDFLSGMKKARRKGNITSRQMGDGFTKKAVHFLIGVAAYFLVGISTINHDLMPLHTTFVLAFNGYMLGMLYKELVSIKENLVALGYLEDTSVFDNIINLIKPKSKE